MCRSSGIRRSQPSPRGEGVAERRMRWREALPKKDASKARIFGESTATGTVQRVTDVQILRDSSFSAFPSRGRCRGATDEVERSATEERCIQGADLRGIDARRKLRATPDSRPTHPKGGADRMAGALVFAAPADRAANTRLATPKPSCGWFWECGVAQRTRLKK